MDLMKDYVERFNKIQRIQHILLMISLIILSLTGFSLKYSDTFLGSLIIKLEGGIQARGILHRISAIMLIAVALWHFLYILFSKEGHDDFLEMKPKIKDFKDFFKSIKNAFTGKEEDIFYEKYTYWQKFQYWGVIFGVATMIISGFVLWFETAVMMILPKYIIDIVLIIHSDEALLLMLILFFWHLYIVHLQADYFPMNKIWLTGKISIEELKKKHYLEFEKLQKINKNNE